MSKNPFIKVVWEDTPENLTQERIKRVKQYFQNKYNSTNVKVKTKISSNNSTTTLKSLDAGESIMDTQYQKKLVKDYITENNITISWDLISRLDDKVNGEIDKTNTNKIKYNKWFLKRIEFSNLLSFGEDNVIDFKDLDGITVVESNPKNFGGKSTATIDLFMFLFFNTTTKSKTNLDLFNTFTDVNEVKVKGYVEIDGNDYIISRLVSRKKTKAGEYTVKNDLEFFKVNDQGDIENLSGEQRRETEKFITSAIGTEEDFLSTILTTGNNLEELIESKPTARGQILTKFLGLEALKEKEEVCKTIYNDWSKKLVSNTYNKVQLEQENETHKTNIDTAEVDNKNLRVSLSEFEVKLKKLEEDRDRLLSSRNNDIDQDLIRTNPTTLAKEISDLVILKKSTKKMADDIDVKEPSEFYLEEDHEKLKKEINGVSVEIRVTSDSVSRNEKLLVQFEKGDICPTCKRALDDVDHSEEIAKLKQDIEDLKTLKATKESEQLKLEVKEKAFGVIKKEYDEYEKNKLRKSRYELEADQKQLDIDAKQLKLDRYENNKKKLEDNTRIDSEASVVKTHIETAKGDIRQTTNTIDRNTTNITLWTDKISVNLDLIKKIKSEEDYLVIFKTYLTIYGKNGISKVIMKNMIPLLNQELYRILSDSCLFTLELNINDKNELEFLMIDNETRVVKSLTTGSGYEKTIASLALRSVLTKVSSLPKPNVVVMDEVFGKVADENLESVGEFFKKIKNYFEHILVISHNTLIRNWSDNIIMIAKDENVSRIDYITTKITQ